jgi:hypothetical protein
MKTRHVALLTGTLLLAAAGVAQAHPEVGYPAYPSGLSGSVSIWGGSHGTAGWAGSLALGSPAVVGAPLVPVAVLPHRHRYGAHCHHGPRGYARHAYPGAHHTYQAKGRKHGRGHGRGNGHGYRD